MVMILDFVNSMLTDLKTHIKPGEEFSQHVLDSHQKIFDAIKAGDADAAQESMLNHICDVENELEAMRDKE